MRVTRDRAKHARAIRRLALQPRHVRTKLVELSRRDLDRLRDRIDWEAGGGAEFDHVEVSEYDDRVVIGVVAQLPNGVRTADSRRAQHTLTLSRPLGDRKVIDAATGKAVGPPGPY